MIMILYLYLIILPQLKLILVVLRVHPYNFSVLTRNLASPRDGKGRDFQVGIPSRREIGTGQSDSFPVPWSRRERDGKGREMPRNDKKLKITLKVIIKAIISYR